VTPKQRNLKCSFLFIQQPTTLTFTMAVDALSCFMKDFMSLSPNCDSVTITIINDNAKQQSPLPSKRRFAAPRRSVSSPLHSLLSPLHQMSRWEAPSAVGPHVPRERMSSPVVKSSPAETSPITIPNDRVCRWESSSPSKSSSSTGLKRPTRKSYDDMDKYAAMDTDFTRRNSATSLPMSLRNLPY
jgi:hypothetical protein